MRSIIPDNNPFLPSSGRRTFRRTVMAALLTVLVPVITAISPFTVYAAEAKGPDIAPEDSSWLYVYGGYGYYRWKMMSQNEYLSVFGVDDTEGIDFKHDATPFIVKKYGVKANFFLISLGLDYFSDRFSFDTDFDNTRDLQDEHDKRSSQLKFLSGLRLGSYMFSATALFRDFNSVLTSRGYRDYDGNLHPVYYYSEEGNMEILDKGSRINWYTVHSEYEIKVEHNLGWSLMGFGLKYKTFESPSVVDIEYEEGYDDYKGSILMFTKNQFFEIFFSSKYLKRIWGDLYWQYYAPLSFTCRYQAENSYFKAGTYPLSVGSAGGIALTYLLSHMKLEAGVDYAMYYSLLSLENVRLKKPVEFTDNDGTPRTAPAGGKVDLELNRLEFYWGFYVHASVYI